MTKIGVMILGIGIIMAQATLAHEGPHGPAALPSPLHHGKVKEAALKGNQKQNVHEDKLVFEAAYENKKLSIYSYLWPVENPSTFVDLSPKTDLKNVTVKVEYPRIKKIELIKDKDLSMKEKVIEIESFDPKGANRFIVHISATHKTETKEAKIQLEKNG